MDDELKDEQHNKAIDARPTQHNPADVTQLHAAYKSRLISANLRTEAVKAGMIDLDGLKLLDFSSVKLDTHDNVIDGRKMMDDLRRAKPWLFGSASSSSIAAAPASQPVRPKTALDMTDAEYRTARAALTKIRF